MTIVAQPADTQPGLTLMDRILSSPIKNRVEFGFFKKKPEVGLSRVWTFTKIWPKLGPTRLYICIITKISSFIYIYIYIYCYNPKIPNLTQNLFKVFSCLSMLSSLSPLTHSPLLLSLTLLPCLTAHAVSRLSLMLSSFRSNSLCRRRRR